MVGLGVGARRAGQVAPPLLACALAVVLPLGELMAQENLRSTFPGRRIGGGTRGECSARLLALLVPSGTNGVFAPGSAARLAILEGPTANPSPLQLSFRPWSAKASGGSAAPGVVRDLPAAPVGITVLPSSPVKGPTLWESSYKCPDGGAGATASDLSFVETASPPAVGLLVADVTPADKAAQAAIAQLGKLCGRSLPVAEAARMFGLSGDEVKGAEWPAQLPVRCP